MTNPNTNAALHRMPVIKLRRYFARFGFFFGALSALACGFGGVLSILRSTS